MAPSRLAAAMSSLLLASTNLPASGAVHRVKMIKRSDEEFVSTKMGLILREDPRYAESQSTSAVLR